MVGDMRCLKRKRMSEKDIMDVVFSTMKRLAIGYRMFFNGFQTVICKNCDRIKRTCSNTNGGNYVSVLYNR